MTSTRLLTAILALGVGSAIAQLAPQTPAEEARKAEIRQRFYEAESQREARDQARQAAAIETQRQQAAANQATAASILLWQRALTPPPLQYAPIQPMPMQPAPRSPLSCRTYRSLGGGLQTDCY